MLAPAYTRTQPATLAQSNLSHADQQRKQAIKAAWAAYNGEIPDPLQVQPNQTNDNVKANRCGPIVDKGVSFLFGQVLAIEATEESGQDEHPIQDFLDGFWGGDDDDKMSLLSDLGINGGVCGQPFAKLMPAGNNQKYPRIVTQDPQNIRPVTAPDDCKLALAYVIEYPTGDDWQKRQIIACVDTESVLEQGFDLQDSWTITDYVRRGSYGTWQQVGTQQDWPYPFAPIFSCQNLPNPNEFWGRPDLTPDLIEQNKVLAFVESNTSRIIKYHGHPRTFATGVRAEQISVAVDDVLCLPAPDSKLAALAAMENFTGVLNFAESIRQNMDEQSRVPSIALGRLQQLPRGNISGVALQLLFQPLMEKTVQKQRLYGKMIRDLSRAALIIAGLIGIERYQDYPIGLHFQNLLPVDDLLAAQTAAIWKSIGVSARTLIVGAGFDPDAEAQQVAQEQGEAPSIQQPPPAEEAGQPQEGGME